MNLTHSRMVATFRENAQCYGNQRNLADSLNMAWTEIYAGFSKADEAFAWLKANVITIVPVTSVHEQSPIWKETANDVPHNRVEREWDDEDEIARERDEY